MDTHWISPAIYHRRDIGIDRDWNAHLLLSDKAVSRCALTLFFALSPSDYETLHHAMTNHTDLARYELQAKRYRYALQFAQYALARNADDADALETLGIASLRLSHFIDGIDALEQLSLLRPLGDCSRIELAIAYGSVGRHQLSRDLLMGVATSHRASPFGLLRIAMGFEAIDEPRLAMEACRRAGRLSPETPEVQYQMGYYAQICGHPASISEALIRHAIDLDPRNLHFRIGLTSMLIRLGRKCEAVAVIDHLIPQQLSEVTCLCCLKRIANLFFDCDDLERAKLCAVRLGQLQTGHSPAAASVA
ncbi:MAG: hypothetical protein P8L85_11420 [Rubripirellula sp.]|nr:hypothetical protein [Rubripirellula sp.]